MDESTIRQLFSKISADVKKGKKSKKEAAKATEDDAEAIEDCANYLDAVEEAQNVDEVMEELRTLELPEDEHPYYVSFLQYKSHSLN